MWPNASITDAGVSGLRASALRRWRTNPSREARSAARRVQPGRRVGGSCSVRRRLSDADTGPLLRRLPCRPIMRFIRTTDWTTTRKRSEEHTSELQSLMRISYAVFCLKKKTRKEKNDKYYTLHI